MEANEAQELKENAEKGEHGLAPVTVTMAILAVVVAAVSLLGHRADTDALLNQTKSTDQWAYYQAKGEKQNLAELGAALSDPSSDAHARFIADVQKYKSEKEPIRANAEAIEKAVEKDNAASESLLHQHHRWAQATTLIQISIALSAITLLTRKKWLQRMSFGVAALGIAACIAAFAGV